MAKRHFDRFQLSADTSFAALLPSGISRCGIYVCEFADGDEYVGQSRRDVCARVACHRRRWPAQIVAVRYSPTPVEDLDQVEQDTVAQRVAAGVKLRNIDLVAMPLRSEALSELVSDVEQASWLTMDNDPSIPRDRVDIARKRLANRGTPAKLAMHPDHDAIVQALDPFFVSVCLPRADLTEQRFWSVSSMGERVLPTGPLPLNW